MISYPSVSPTQQVDVVEVSEIAPQKFSQYNVESMGRGRTCFSVAVLADCQRFRDRLDTAEGNGRVRAAPSRAAGSHGQHSCTGRPSQQGVGSRHAHAALHAASQDMFRIIT